MRLTVGAGLLAIVLVGALALMLYGNGRDALTERAEAQVRDATALAAQLVQEQTTRFTEIVEINADRLGAMSERPLTRLDADQRAAITPVLSDMVSSTRGLSGAGVLSPDGRLLVASPAADEFYGRSFAERDYYRGVTEQRSPYVSEVFESVRGRKSVTVAALIRSPAGRTLGVLTVGLERRTQELATAFNRSQGLGLVVTDQAGGVVAVSGVSSDEIVSRADDPLVREALEGRVGSASDDRRIASSAPVPGIGWTVSARLPTEVALEDADDLRTHALVLGAIIAALLAGLTAGVVAFQRRVQGLREDAAKRVQAVHLHDGVVQTLVVAQMARRRGDHETADSAVEDALEESKRITAELLPDELEAGDLVRPEPPPGA